MRVVERRDQGLQRVIVVVGKRHLVEDRCPARSARGANVSKSKAKVVKSCATGNWPISRDKAKQVISNITKVWWWVIGIVFGALITHAVESYLNQEKEERMLAMYYVANMPPQCKAKTSKELDQQIKTFVEAAKRGRPEGRGMPVWRDDCSIGAEFSLKLGERLGARE